VSKASSQFTGIQAALAKLLRECPESRHVVADVLEWLVQIERERHGDLPTQPGQHRSRSGTHRGDAIKGYKIKRGRQGEMLVERRYDSPKDFRCGYEIYDATAEAVATAPKRGMGFDAIMDSVTKRLGRRPPEYLPRMCLRFWLFGKEPILIRSRARYEPISPPTFVQQSKDAWRTLAKRTKK
jgi:hypothetical protein